MRIELGAKVKTQDGHDVGKVQHLVMNPETAEVRSVVVEQGLFNRHSRMVPVHRFVNSTSEYAVVDCTESELEELPEFVESDYTSPPPGYSLPVSYPGGGLLWPIGYPVSPVPVAPEPTGNAEADETTEMLRRLNLENAVIDSDSDVMSRDGEKIGEVERLVIDADSGKPARLVVRKGFLLPETLELPVELIASVDDGVVMLNLDKDEALRLATPTDER